MAIPCNVQPGFSFTVYPCAIDSSDQLPITVDNQTPVKAEVVNRHREAIIAIESELGINPSGVYTTVRARLDALEAGAGGGGVGGGISLISKDGAPIINNATELDFLGEGVSVVDAGSGTAQIEILGTTTQVQETLAVDFLGDTSFTLSTEPLDDTAVQMYINGQKQRYATDYVVSGTSATYTGALTLDTTDEVEFWYLVSASLAGGSGTGSITIREEGVDVDTAATIINFTGSFVTASQTAPGSVQIDVNVGQNQETLPVTFNGQTAFVLSQMPIEDGFVQMYVNGVKQEYGVDYTGIGNSITYTGSVPLITTDVVEFWYLANVANGAPVVAVQDLAQTLGVGNSTDGYDIVFTMGSVMSSSDGYVTVDDDLYVTGKLTVDGLIDPTGMVFSEQSSAPYDPSTTGTEGLVWVRDDNEIVYIDQTGAEYLIKGSVTNVSVTAEGVSGGMADNVALVTNASTTPNIAFNNIGFNTGAGGVRIGVNVPSSSTASNSIGIGENILAGAGGLGVRNTIIGMDSVTSTSISESVVIGTEALDQVGLDSVSQGVFIGAYVGENATGRNLSNDAVDQIWIGNRAGPNGQHGDALVLIGSDAGNNISTDASDFSVGIGHSVDLYAGTNNIVVGANAGGSSGAESNVVIGATAGSTIAGNGNTVLGDAANVNAGFAQTVVVGQSAVAGSTGTISIGNSADGANGSSQIVIGQSAIARGSTGIVMGLNAGSSTMSGDSVLIGSSSGSSMTGGSSGNVAIGNSSGSAITSGSSNTLLGRSSGGSITSGGSNTIIGNNAGGTLSTGSSNTIIGTSAGVPAPGQSNFINLDGMYTADKLNVIGAFGAGASNDLSSQSAVYGFYTNSADTQAILSLDNSGGTNGAETRIHSGDQDPSGVVTAPAGSLYLSSVNSGSLWKNVDGSTSWLEMGSLWPNTITVTSTTQTTQLTTFETLSAFEFDPTEYDGYASIEFRALIETDNASDAVEIRIFNVDTSSVVGSSTLSTTNTSVTLVSADITNEIDTTSSIYEVQLRLATTGSPNTASCKRAELRIT